MGFGAMRVWPLVVAAIVVAGLGAIIAPTIYMHLLLGRPPAKQLFSPAWVVNDLVRGRTDATIGS